MREDYAAAEKVLHQIQPKREALAAAKQALLNTEAEIASLKETLAGQEKAVEAAQAVVNADAGTKQEAERLNLAVQTLKQTLPQYDKLNVKQMETRLAEQTQREKEDQKAAVQEQFQQEREVLDGITAELEALTGIDAQAVARENEYTAAQKDADTLAGIQTQTAGILQREKVLAGEKAALRAMTEAASHAEQRHHELYQAFIRGQAGLIAAELEENLTAHGTAVCPVCHSEFRKGQEHRFAVLSDETPAQAEVESAKRNAEEKEKSRAAKDKEVTELQTGIEKDQESILREVKRLLPDCGGWAVLTAEGYLSGKTVQFQQTASEKKSAWKEAVRKRARNQELMEQKAKKERQIEALTNGISQLDEELTACRLKIGTLAAAVTELQSQLPYSDKGAAEEQIRLNEEQRDRLMEQAARNQEVLDAAKQKRDTISGNLSGKQNSLPKLEQAGAGAEMALHSALEENGFLKLEDAEAALLPLEGRDGGEWLEEQQAALVKYRGDLENTRERIKELTEQTKEAVYTDLNALQQQIDQAAASYNAANSACTQQEKQLENHRAAAEKVAGAKKALEKTEAAWKRLDLLASLAVGTIGDGGKLSFDRYVMGTMFQEILEMANRRLNDMSGGKYELIHQVRAGRQNAKAGLDVEVLDMTTGKQRNYGSLSGGESFLVSLSLALGLSDVAQNHAGGKRLDALFIDEGFGSLDSHTVDTALNVLTQLTEGNCLVGIISHVGKLEESIPQKIRVKNGEQGSTLQIE